MAQQHYELFGSPGSDSPVGTRGARRRGASCAGCPIRHVAICAALDDRELRDLEAIMSHRGLGPRQSLVLEGDPADYAYNVISGGLKISKSLADGRVQMVGLLLAGDFLGLPARSAYGFAVESTGPTELCRFPRAELMAVFARHESLQARVLTAVHDELAAAQEHMLLLGRKHATERLASFLLHLHRHAGRFAAARNRIDIPLHRAEIADYLGLTTETVSRSFSQLRSLGVLRLEQPDEVTILDRQRLERIADHGWSRGAHAGPDAASPRPQRRLAGGRG